MDLLSPICDRLRSQARFCVNTSRGHPWVLCRLARGRNHGLWTQRKNMFLAWYGRVWRQCLDLDSLFNKCLVHFFKINGFFRKFFEGTVPVTIPNPNSDWLHSESMLQYCQKKHWRLTERIWRQHRFYMLSTPSKSEVLLICCILIWHNIGGQCWTKIPLSIVQGPDCILKLSKLWNVHHFLFFLASV